MTGKAAGVHCRRELIVPNKAMVSRQVISKRIRSDENEKITALPARNATENLRSIVLRAAIQSKNRPTPATMQRIFVNITVV